MIMQKLIVQRGTRYEIRADEIAPGLYRLSTCIAGSPRRFYRFNGNDDEPTAARGPSSGETMG
jgi:hypothetical protein